MYQYDMPHLKAIMHLYANHLSSTNQHKEAALAYEYLQDHASAWPCYRSANLWREALSSAILADTPAAELESLATSLAEGLVEAKEYLAASTIYLDHLSDLPTAIRNLCQGCHFGDALRLVTLHKQTPLIETIIDPALAERSGDMTEFLADMKTQLQAQLPRLRELRTKKAENPLAFYDGLDDFGGQGGDNIPDNISLAPTDTTSGGTFMTRYTQRTGTTLNTQTTRKTSKNKRREERKRARGKKGTVYEEEYLVNSIERLIERINGMHDEISRLVEGLVRRGMRERADAVASAVQLVLQRCREAVEEVYAPQEAGGAQAQGQGQGLVEALGLGGAGDAGEAYRPSGADRTFLDSLAEVEKKRVAPVVKGFEKLGLLG